MLLRLLLARSLARARSLVYGRKSEIRYASTPELPTGLWVAAAILFILFYMIHQLQKYYYT